MLFKSKISFFSIRKKVVILTTKKTNYLTFRLGKKFRVCKFQFFSLFYRNKYFFETGYPAGYPESDYNRIYGRISGSGFFYNRIIRNPASNSLFTTLFLIFSIGSDEEEGFSDDSYQDPDYKIQTVEPSSDSEDDNMGVVNRYNIVIPFCFLVMGVAQIKVSIWTTRYLNFPLELCRNFSFHWFLIWRIELGYGFSVGYWISIIFTGYGMRW